jgi:hypothetical protein
MIYHYDKLIIGGTLSAYCCAWCNQYPIIHLADNPHEPQPWDHFPAGIDWSPLHFPNPDKGLITNDGIYSRGLQKKLLYTRLATILGMAGKAPFAGNVTRIEVDRANRRVALSLNQNRTALLSYNKLYVFDGEGISWDLVPSQQSRWFSVTDWYNINRVRPHGIDLMFDKQDDPFVWRIYWYLSDRVDQAWRAVFKSQFWFGPDRMGAVTVQRDFCSVSFLTAQQLDDPSFGEGVSRMKVMRMLRACKIQGMYSYTTPKGVRFHRAPKVEFQKREVRPLVPPTFEDVDDIRFLRWGDDIAHRFLLRYINHVDLSSRLNETLFANYMVEHGKHKARLQRFELAATILNWSESRGKQLPMFPAKVISCGRSS